MPHIYQERLALNLMMMFCYGTRFSSIEDPLLDQILKDASTIARYDSQTEHVRSKIQRCSCFTVSGQRVLMLKILFPI